MEIALEIIAAVLLAAGAFFAVTGAVGLVRMPDFWTRVHPAGKADTLAQTLILAGLLIHPNRFPGEWNDPLKLILITVLLYITAPTATHAVARAAHVAGLGKEIEVRSPQADGAPIESTPESKEGA